MNLLSANRLGCITAAILHDLLCHLFIQFLSNWWGSSGTSGHNRIKSSQSFWLKDFFLRRPPGVLTGGRLWAYARLKQTHSIRRIHFGSFIWFVRFLPRLWLQCTHLIITFAMLRYIIIFFLICLQFPVGKFSPLVSPSVKKKADSLKTHTFGLISVILLSFSLLALADANSILTPLPLLFHKGQFISPNSLLLFVFEVVLSFWFDF